MLGHYVDVELPLDSLSPNKDVSHVCKIIHSVHGGHPFAIDFPDIERSGDVIVLKKQDADVDMKMASHAFMLGRRVRIFADKAFLASLKESLSAKLPQSCYVGPITLVPRTHGWRQVTGLHEYHVHPGSQEKRAARLLAHLMKKHGCLPKGEPLVIPPAPAPRTGPYLDLFSQSSQRAFRRFIDIQPSPDAGAGKFTTYGLSAGGSVPTF